MYPEPPESLPYHHEAVYDEWLAQNTLRRQETGGGRQEPEGRSQETPGSATSFLKPEV